MWGGYFVIIPGPSADAAVDDMYGGAGDDQFVGACADLDKATEAVAGGIDFTFNVKLLFGEFEIGGVLCP